MSMGGVGGQKKSAWSIPVNFFSLLSRWPVEKQTADYHGFKLVYIMQLEVSWLPWEMAFFFGYSFHYWLFLDVSLLNSFGFIMYSVSISEPPSLVNIARCIPLKRHGEGLVNVRQDF